MVHTAMVVLHGDRIGAAVVTQRGYTLFHSHRLNTLVALRAARVNRPLIESVRNAGEETPPGRYSAPG